MIHSPETPVAIIGAGLSGLTAAIRLAEKGVNVHIFEAAPKAGGRTRSFYESKVDCLCDNGPHLLLGAYQSTQKLLHDCNITDHLAWQTSLDLPLWDKTRGLFHFQVSTWLPFHIALLKAVACLPGHNKTSALAMLKLATTLKSKRYERHSVKAWLEALSMPDALIHDLIEPLCIGAMNEDIDTACSLSFRRVLHESFANHQQARLGWFTKPLDEALIDPLCKHGQALGVKLQLRKRISALNTCSSQAHQGMIQIEGQSFQQVILALPAYASDRLLGHPTSCETRGICNIHLWFEQDIHLPALFIGALATTGQWFFDISAQMHQSSSVHHLKHYCAVISAEQDSQDDLKLVNSILNELREITGTQALKPVHYRIIREKRATVLVRPDMNKHDLPKAIIDASERPRPGDLPATIEGAVQRGEQAAALCLKNCIQHHAE